MDPNSRQALLLRRERGSLTWRGPALMSFARAASAVGVQAIVAAILAVRGSSTPWADAAPWMPGYLVARFQVLCRGTSLAILLVGFAWSLQHVFMPLTFDPTFMAFRLFSSVPNSVFQTLLYLRIRRLLPFVVAHALLDGASIMIGVLLPLLR